MMMGYKHHLPILVYLPSEISKTQDDEVGDGTTSVVVLASELLREAEKLVGTRMHPQNIIAGWRKAADCARAALTDLAVDHSSDPEQFRQDLLNIARTTLSSKIVYQDKDYFAKLAVDAVMRLKVSVIKREGGRQGCNNGVY